MLRNPWICALAAVLLVACGETTTKQSDRCQPEGSVCADGQVCESGACVPCTGNDQCGGLVCLVGRCRSCSDDFQCGAGKLCQNGTCTGCHKSLDCPLDQACVNEACVPCASSTDCGDGRACIEGKCAACARDTQCDNGKVCVESACVACTDTRQCADGLACVAGACAACTDSTQCLDGDVCAGGKCGACASRDQCPTGEVCANGHCTACATSDDCERGEACVGGLCGVCRGTADCAAGEVCRDGVCGRCGTSAECEGGQVCVSGACQPCTSRAQCEAGFVCAQGSCRACADQGECNAGEACVAGRCGPCASADDCAAGDACVAGVCGPCAHAIDCRAGEICHGSTHRCGQPGAADHLELVGGQNQRGVVGTRLAQDLALRVVDAANDPVPGVALSFAPQAAEYGQPGAATVTSDREGLVSTTWLLGPLAGPQYLKVSGAASALPDAAHTGRATFTFAATADADVPDHLEILGGNGQTVAAGTKAPVPLAVAVVDRWGNGIPGVKLNFAVGSGAGSLDASSVTSGSDGSAQAFLTLGRTPGTNTVSVARTPALPDVNALGKAGAAFTLTGVAGPPDHLAKVAGDNQSAQLRQNVPNDLQVRVLDRFENPVPGAVVRFGTTSDLQLSTNAATANAQGLAATHVAIGTTAGALTVVASGSPAFPDLAATGRASVSFSLTALPGDPDHLEMVSGDGQTAILGTTLPVAPAVRVVDAYGNPLSGVSLAFTASSGGQVASSPVTSDAQGLASSRWTLGFSAGAQTLVVGRSGTALPDLAGTGHPTVLFTATTPTPAASGLSPGWLPIAGGALTISGSGFGSDAQVTVGGQPATVTSRSDTQLVVTAPSVARGDEPVVVTSGGTSTGALNVFYALKFTPTLDGSVVTGAGDWPWQSNVASDVYPANDPQAGQPVPTGWDGNELRELYLGYDDTNVYVGVVGRAQKQNAIVGWIYEDGLTSQTRPNATADIRTLTDGVGDGQGDGNGCYWQTPTCSNNGQALSLDDMLSAGFLVQVPGWAAHYGFGRTGNAIDLTSLGVHNAVGVRDLFNGADFGWSPSRVLHTANAQEWAIPWTTFARDKINNGTASRPITKLQVFVRIVANGGQAWPNQGLPADANSIAGDYRVTAVSTLDVR